MCWKWNPLHLQSPYDRSRANALMLVPCIVASPVLHRCVSVSAVHTWPCQPEATLLQVSEEGKSFRSITRLWRRRAVCRSDNASTADISPAWSHLMILQKVPLHPPPHPPVKTVTCHVRTWSHFHATNSKCTGNLQQFCRWFCSHLWPHGGECGRCTYTEINDLLLVEFF